MYVCYLPLMYISFGARIENHPTGTELGLTPSGRRNIRENESPEPDLH
jgi:hypothetical protein